MTQFKPIIDELIQSPLLQEFKEEKIYSFRVSSERVFHAINIPVCTFGPNDATLPVNFQLRVGLENTRLKHIDPEIGFFHQGIEKIAPELSIPDAIKAISRLNPLIESPITLAFIMALEAKYAINEKISETTSIMRTMALECARIFHHCIVIEKIILVLEEKALATMLHMLLHDTKLLYRLVSRTKKNELQHQLGSILEIPSHETIKDIKKTSKNIAKQYIEMQEAIIENITLNSRLEQLAKIPLISALDLGLSGIVLKACGRSDDTRISSPYLEYQRHIPPVITKKEGDMWARLQVRLHDIEISLKLIEALTEKIESSEKNHHDTPIPSTLSRGLQHTYTEAPEGIMIISLCSNEERLTRVRIKSPSFSLIGALPAFLKNAEIDDLPLILSGLGINELEADR